MRENEFSNDVELSLDDLDAVAGGAGGANSAELDGRITEALPNTMFRVQLDDGNTILCSISGQLRTSFVRIVAGDRVRVQTNPYDSSRGRIISRYK